MLTNVEFMKEMFVGFVHGAKILCEVKTSYSDGASNMQGEFNGKHH
jgi:hypothetical protein